MDIEVSKNVVKYAVFKITGVPKNFLILNSC